MICKQYLPPNKKYFQSLNIRVQLFCYQQTYVGENVVAISDKEESKSEEYNEEDDMSARL